MLDINFAGQKPEEEVMALFHISIWAYLRQMVVTVILIILPLPVYILSHNPQLGVVCWVLGWTLALYMMGRTWYLWSHNIVLVTNIRVIALVQDGIFSRHFKESYLDSICQVTARVKGPFRTTLDFGDVLVQTEAELWLESLEKPYDVKQSIFEAIEERKKEHPRSG